jgi:putative transposase
MTERKGKAELIDVKELLGRDQDFVRAALEALLQAALEVEMTEAIGAEKGERTETRLSYRSGYYGRSLVTRVGTLELRVPQDRFGRFSSCSSATSVRRRPWWAPWRRCTCRASRRGR